ncbi:MAG: DUF2279 domain-containing protein [Chitinophagaceae bacterium]
MKRIFVPMFRFAPLPPAILFLPSLWGSRLRHSLLACLLLLITNPGNTQSPAGDSIAVTAATDTGSGPVKSRVWLVAGINVVGYGTTLALLNNAWYKNEARTSFHTFDDSREWLQMDKWGHAWTTFNAARASTALWEWTGLSHRKAVWLGSATSLLYMTGIEYLDAHSAKWGWSWSDMAANATGVGIYAAQALLWNEQRIQLKFSFHSNRYSSQQLEERADDLFGRSWYERMLKDYNAQTYWLSANLRSFLPKSKLPVWLNVAIGYGATGMFGGFENKWTDGQNQAIDRRDIRRLRQFYLSPDIDFTRIPTKSKFLKTTFSILNAFKLPAPTFMIDSRGKAKGYLLYF